MATRIRSCRGRATWRSATRWSTRRAIIPLDGRPHAGKSIATYMGDARGHWEGDTLVVETTNFIEQAAFRGASKHLKLTERFKPIGPKTVDWSVDARRCAYVDERRGRSR